MQKRAKIVIAILLSTVAISILLWNNINRTNDFSHNMFALKSADKITKITLSPNNPDLPYLILEKIDGEWIVKNKIKTYLADTLSINQLLKWAMPNLQIKCPVADAAKINVTKDITLYGTKAIFSVGNQEAHTVYVGLATPTQDATYMFYPGTERPCEVTVPGFVGYLTPYFNTNINNWRSPFLIDVASQEIKSLKVTYPSDPKESFFITQSPNQIELFNSKNQAINANQSLLAGYLEMSKTLARESGDIAGINKNTNAVKSILEKTPMAIFTYQFTTKPAKTISLYPMDVIEGETYAMETQDGTPKTVETTLYWGKSNDENTLWVVQDIIIHNRLKKLSHFVRP